MPAIDANGAAKPTPVPPPPKDPPKVPSHADRRVTFQKIEEVWDDNQNCYQSGWTDQRVATDLGLPLALIRLIRSENFGAIGDNPEIKAVLEQVKSFKDEMAKLNNSFGELKASYLGIANRMSALSNAAQLIDRRLDKIKT